MCGPRAFVNYLIHDIFPCLFHIDSIDGSRRPWSFDTIKPVDNVETVSFRVSITEQSGNEWTVLHTPSSYTEAITYQLRRVQSVEAKPGRSDINLFISHDSSKSTYQARNSFRISTERLSLFYRPITSNRRINILYRFLIEDTLFGWKKIYSEVNWHVFRMFKRTEVPENALS